MSKTRIYLSPPHMGGLEQEYINDAFNTNWIAPLGPNVDEFEKELASYNSIDHCAALVSGTSAIHLALIILGVSRGDEVLVSSFTFSASVNPIVYQGAVPILIDSEKETWNMSPELLEEAIRDRIKKGKKPKAIVVVHLYGMPANMNEIMSISKKYEIPVIEDAAEALGSKYRGRNVGTFGDFGVYSFNGNKIITTSGGGALVSYNRENIEKARFYATQARDKALHYQHSSIGFNYRMSNIVAGIGRGQLKFLDEFIEIRRSNTRFYEELLKDFPVSFLDEKNISSHPEDYFSNHWLTCVLMDRSKILSTPHEICDRMASLNIECRPLWKPMHQQPIFKDYPFYGSGVSDDFFSRGICLPSGVAYSDEEKERIMRIKENMK